MFLDLDNFKRINDTMGHRAGDRLLEEVAVRLRQATREYDPVGRGGGDTSALTIGRLGGDEFLLAITDLEHPDDAATVATRVLGMLKAPIQTQDGEVRVSASIGVSVFPQDGSDVDELLKNADTALYHAKDRGRNTFEFYSPELSAATRARMVLEGELRHAVEHQEFVLHYQPQIDADGDRVVAVEALLRWAHPQRGMVSPGTFMDALEQTRLIRTLGPWIAKTAAAQLRAWHDAGLSDLRMAINLSGEQLWQADVADRLDEAVAEAGVAPSFIEFEVTESVFIEAASQGVETIGALKARGYGIAMDDFGTGYSSLGYLARFPVDCVKIDQSFTRDMLTNPTQAAVVDTIIDLARRLNIELVAEGIERPEQCDRLRNRGCPRMQGYLFGKPMPAAEFFSWAWARRRGGGGLAARAAPVAEGI
jgi:diguanylate cyclase (GGDEF)-like protein